ncbi:MAG: response regulator transcription factor [Candidatus Symbiothrix sp.]|jgi:DNA-binding response OmpR family regulator|nr:response regulator transcription factor [Candidatus Symbiothrix sp.]
MREKKILLVDDDYRNSMLLKRFLEQDFDNVLYAENGKVAWEYFQSFKPELVLLDVNMPEMDGFELAQKIRSCNKSVILFFLTDRTEKSDRLRGFELKGNDYIPKPFYPEELIAKIKERFENSSGNQAIDNIFRFGNAVFNYSLCTIGHSGKTQKISSRQADILLILVKHLNSVVEREAILNQVWGDNSYANSLALNVQITYLRRLIADDKSVVIESLKKRGYVMKENIHY